MLKYKIIKHPSEMRIPLFYHWQINYKCLGSNYFFDGEYGYCGKNSHAKNLWLVWRNKVLSWFGLCIEWRCDESGKSRIRRQ